MTKVAIYSRVSTGGQDVENQNLALRQWAEQRNLQVAGVYQEEESAWRGGHQRELARLFRDAQRGRFQVVLVWALDRLSREGPLAILTLVHRLARCEVKVLSYQEAWTEAPGELAEILYAITGWVARMESRRLSERTKAGLARAATQGHYPGRPPGAKDKRRRKKRSPRVPIWEPVSTGLT
jgi:putative DNA-invertase from lambdoid prophage Rac